MEIPIGHRRLDDEEQRSPKILCDAQIPLRYVKDLSSGALKKLCKLGIMTLEDLAATPKEVICESIRGRELRKTVLAIRQDIVWKAYIPHKEHIERLERRIRDKDIRLTPAQRASIIGVYVFAKILRSIEAVLKYILEPPVVVPFRQRAVLDKVYDISLRLIARTAS